MASSSRSKQTTMPHQSMDTNFGCLPETVNQELPSRETYDRLEMDYISSLTARKREKALLSQEMFDNIWDVLHDPRGSLVNSQFRFWVRKMFTLATLDTDGPDGEVKSVVLHENRPVAVRTQIYNILCYCHQLCAHGGRDRTTAAVRAHFSWIPKELIARFVKACPQCSMKKAGYWGIAPKGPRARNAKGVTKEEQLSETDLLMMSPNNELPAGFMLEDPSGFSSKKRKAWNKQPTINVDIPLGFIHARFPQPAPYTSTEMPLQIDMSSIADQRDIKFKPTNPEHDCSPWLADLVGLPAPQVRRSQTMSDAAFPRPHIAGPSMPLVNKSHSEHPPPSAINPYSLRPLALSGRDMHSPSPVFSDDETDMEDYEPPAYVSKGKERACAPIDPILLAEEEKSMHTAETEDRFISHIRYSL